MCPHPCFFHLHHSHLWGTTPFFLTPAPHTFSVAPQVREILAKMGDRRQTLLFSATLPKTLAEFAQVGLGVGLLLSVLVLVLVWLWLRA